MKIPKLEKYAGKENSDAVDTRSDQSGSAEETPTMCASSSTFLDLHDNCPNIFPFTGGCGIRIPLPVTDTPFSWLKVFLDDSLIHLFTRGTNQYVHQYLSCIVSMLLRPQLPRCHKRWNVLSITGIDRQPEIVITVPPSPFSILHGMVKKVPLPFSTNFKICTFFWQWSKANWMWGQIIRGESSLKFPCN